MNSIYVILKASGYYLHEQSLSISLYLLFSGGLWSSQLLKMPLLWLCNLISLMMEFRNFFPLTTRSIFTLLWTSTVPYFIPHTRQQELCWVLQGLIQMRLIPSASRFSILALTLLNSEHNNEMTKNVTCYYENLLVLWFNLADS